MPDILGIAEAGMRVCMRELEAVSRNVANADTLGYKREIYLNRGFQAYLPETGGTDQAAAPVAASDDAGAAAALAQFGAQSQALHDDSPGALKYTGAPLNFAIEGRGYFQLQTPQGVALTRDGQFRLDDQGQLVSAEGWPVALRGDLILDRNELTLRPDGTLVAGDATARFDLVDVAAGSLQMLGAGRYRALAAPTPVEDARLRQGFVEASNVDSLSEMVRVLGVVRQMESSQQVMRAYDEIIDNAISSLGQF